VALKAAPRARRLDTLIAMVARDRGCAAIAIAIAETNKSMLESLEVRASLSLVLLVT
jgi:hypothetical protein